jgi:hypothetical protein
MCEHYGGPASSVFPLRTIVHVSRLSLAACNGELGGRFLSRPRLTEACHLRKESICTPTDSRDPNGQLLPRAKRHDDKTLVVWRP